YLKRIGGVDRPIEAEGQTTAGVIAVRRVVGLPVRKAGRSEGKLRPMAGRVTRLSLLRCIGRREGRFRMAQLTPSVPAHVWHVRRHPDATQVWLAVVQPRRRPGRCFWTCFGAPPGRDLGRTERDTGGQCE